MGSSTIWLKITIRQKSVGKSTQKSCCQANDELDGASTIHTQEQGNFLGIAQAHALLQKCLFVVTQVETCFLNTSQKTKEALK